MASTNQDQFKQWYRRTLGTISIDDIVKILQIPFVIFIEIILISYLARNTFWADGPKTSHAYWAGFMLFGLLSPWAVKLSHRVAFGASRPVSWEDEIVVITGGSGGLGRVIAETYGMRGVSVAVLDVQPFYDVKGQPFAEESNIRWYECDVGDEEAVKKAKALIEKDVRRVYNLLLNRRVFHSRLSPDCDTNACTQLGTPTILINNAGIVNGQPLLSLSSSQIKRNFRINLLSHFHMLQAFLPSMLARPNGGTIVTVASVLGHLGASQLSDYTAAKAGLIAMHSSLRAELNAMAQPADAPPGARNVRMILVTPGQLSTPLFEGLETPSNFFGPVVSPVKLAKEIVEMIDRGRGGVIAQPLYARWIEVLGVLPYGVQRFARSFSGMDTAMEGFRGSKRG